MVCRAAGRAGKNRDVCDTSYVGGRGAKSQYQYTLQSSDIGTLYDGANALLARLQQEPGLQDVTSNLQIRSPQVDIHIDRDKAASLQVNAQQIENALYDAYGPRWVSTIYAAINEYKVLLELKPEYQSDPHALSLLYFKSAPGRLIPLDTLASVST